MRIICLSDIHYATGYPGGIVLADIAAVERQFTNEAIARNVDVCFFAGDRFLSHTPEEWVRIAADLEQRHRNNLGLVTFSLVGNHDWWGKSPVKGHSNQSAQDIWADVLDNLVICDKPQTYRHHKCPDLYVHALPAEYEPDLSLYEFGPGLNVLLFHAAIKGALLDDETDYRSPKGIPVEVIDDPRFALVLGGDFHIPQRLPFKNTQGGYVGSCIQQTRRDRGEARGFLYIDTDAMSFEFIDSTCPRFVDLTFDLHDGIPTPDMVLTKLAELLEDPAMVILTLHIKGDKESLIACPDLKPVMAPLVRNLFAIRKIPYTTTAGISTTTMPVDDATPYTAQFEAYLKLTGVNLDGLSPDRLLEKAGRVLPLSLHAKVLACRVLERP